MKEDDINLQERELINDDDEGVKLKRSFAARFLFTRGGVFFTFHTHYFVSLIIENGCIQQLNS